MKKNVRKKVVMACIIAAVLVTGAAAIAAGTVKPREAAMQKEANVQQPKMVMVPSRGYVEENAEAVKAETMVSAPKANEENSSEHQQTADELEKNGAVYVDQPQEQQDESINEPVVTSEQEKKKENEERQKLEVQRKERENAAEQRRMEEADNETSFSGGSGGSALDDERSSGGENDEPQVDSWSLDY